NLSTLNQNVADGFTALNQADANEAAAREAGDNALQNQINNESAARESGDSALQNQIKNESAARQADVSRLDNRIHDVSKEVDTVGALSMAMSGLHPLDYDEGDARFQLSAAVGTYDGTEALALGGFYHFNHDSMISVGVATDLGADEHRMGANIGYTLRIGQGGHVSRPSEGTVSDIMKDIKNLEQKQAKLEQENEQLKQQLAALQK
ncbi:YadA-like family protein, partial [Dialister sp.]|uniref:YadA C-terminal domain-containing protein n=1 Tax=Dialister sp. TaxID=1955814 RepID=UPI003F0932A9